MQQRSNVSKLRPSARKAAAGAARPVAAWGNALPSQEEKDELKRNSILHAAAHCFNRSGFHGTSMDDIAERLGVTKPALYRYVKNKHEVLAACFNLVMDMSFRHLEDGERTGRNGLDKLRVTIRGYLAELIGDFGHPVVILEEGALLPDQLRNLIRRRDQLERRYRALVEEGMRDGSIIPCNSKLAVFALFGAMNWVPKWYRQGGEWSAEVVADQLVQLITRALDAHPQGLRLDAAGAPATLKTNPTRLETSNA
ncbi:TetR/AcrR family transcriptional regulator [Ramlibacter sp. PS4R-6]|uniref:TetR/AcrR family transcriptional regulator n=1 Tax=Ramlibacter sp. PS4R-6 TaxID=3133438 RepID=UPI0030B64622